MVIGIALKDSSMLISLGGAGMLLVLTPVIRRADKFGCVIALGDSHVLIGFEMANG